MEKEEEKQKEIIIPEEGNEIKITKTEELNTQADINKKEENNEDESKQKKMKKLKILK